jgi:DNA-binding MarR family transcriptional regulator
VTGVVSDVGEAADARLPPAAPGHVAFLLRRAANLAAAYAPCFEDAPCGIDSPRDIQVLDAIAEPGAASCQQEIGRRLGIDRSTMVKLVDRFEAAGQVARRRNPRDRRSYVLALTEHGHAALAQLDPAVRAADARLTAALAPADRARLADLLATLLHRPLPAAPDRTGALLTQAHHHVRHGLAAALACSGLQPRQYEALTALAQGPCSQQQLARRLAVSDQAALQVVDDLEGAGHVSRDRDPADRRRYALRPTPQGRLTLDAARTAVTAAEPALTAALTPQARAALTALLTALLHTP